jgi:hypothetical protein
MIMSTIFGVKTTESDEIIEVAYRNNSGRFSWLSPLAILLGDDIEVIAIDNESQGILNIGDIRKIINSYGKSR